MTATDVLSAWNSGATDFVGQVTCATANNFTAGVPNTQAQVLTAIPINDGRTQVLAERVPTGKRFLFDTLDVRVTRGNGSAGSVIGAFQIKEPGGVWQTAPAGSTIRVRIRDVSDTNTSVSGTLIYREVDA